MNAQKSHTIAFDFDGVIAQYQGFIHEEPIKEPIQEVGKAIRKLKKRGHKILIYSTRGDDFLKKYREKFSIPVDYINKRPDKQGKNAGKPIAFVYGDDRSICHKGQSAAELVKEIESFKPHWK